MYGRPATPSQATQTRFLSLDPAGRRWDMTFLPSFSSRHNKDNSMARVASDKTPSWMSSSSSSRACPVSLSSSIANESTARTTIKTARTGFSEQKDKREHPVNCCLSLETRCRLVVVSHLERYPPEAFGIFSEEEWESIVRLRHEKTSPLNGRGGLDGTGRITPAIRASSLAEIEQTIPHLAYSDVVDRLVWKDCVEYKFKRGGITRPPQLECPWPVLVEKLDKAKMDLLQLLDLSPSSKSLETAAKTTATRTTTSTSTSSSPSRTMSQSIRVLTESPMNVALLQATGVGKAVRKFLKASDQKKKQHVCFEIDVWKAQLVDSKTGMISLKTQLHDALERWKRLAQASGVVSMKTSKSTATAAAAATSETTQSSSSSSTQQEQEDWRLAQEAAGSWRELYRTLEQRELERRANQGARMRELRQNLCKDRPRIVKVRPAAGKKQTQYDRILEKQQQLKTKNGSTTTATTSMMAAVSSNKMQQLRQESEVAASWQKSASSSKQPRSKLLKQAPSFGAAVAFAASSTNKKKSSSNKRKAARQTTTIALAGGKRMKLPSKTKLASRFLAKR